MAKPKPRIYRSPTKRRNVVRYHSSTGERVYKDGGKPRTKLPFTLYPDDAPVICSATTKTGNRCKVLATLGSTVCYKHGSGPARFRRRPCEAHCLPYPHRRFSKGCLAERPGIIMAPPKPPPSQWTLTPRLLSPLGR